jgi:hypothetical protein
VTNQEQYLLRFAEWTPLAFMMCFLTEGVGLGDVGPGTNIWSDVKLPVILALMQSLSVFQLFMFPLAPNVWMWTLDRCVAMVTFSFMLPRLFSSEISTSSIPRTRLWINVKPMTELICPISCWLCVCPHGPFWCASIFVAGFVPKTMPPSSFVHRQGLHFVFQASFEVLSKVLYLHVTVDIHSAVFDEGVRASRRLEELRQMMSVVWECPRT